MRLIVKSVTHFFVALVRASACVMKRRSASDGGYDFNTVSLQKLAHPKIANLSDMNPRQRSPLEWT